MANFEKLSAQRLSFQQALHHWYRAHHRKLPWRDSPSLYKTVVSEFMLQQTQVATVLPYFARWLEELPGFAELAAAPADKVMKLWEGLGYYSRARNLHKLAQAVVALPGPPRPSAAWRELPGIGPYTAAAITSIAFSEPAACVDGNVVRILARLTADARPFRDSAEAAKYFSPLAEALIQGSDPGTHNQAMMELGATVCVRQKPMCLVCPVADFCAGLKTGEPAGFPRLQPKQIEQRSVIRIWCEKRGRLLLRRTAAGAKRLAGLYELPEPGDLGSPTFDRTSLLAVRRRAITRFQITESIYSLKPDAVLEKMIRANASLVWVELTALDTLTLSGPHKRWIGEIHPRAVSAR